VEELWCKIGGLIFGVVANFRGWPTTRGPSLPDAAGGEGGHGAAKLDRVIHRYVFNLE
jgi:hypothetical protein